MVVCTLEDGWFWGYSAIPWRIGYFCIMPITACTRAICLWTVRSGLLFTIMVLHLPGLAVAQHLKAPVGVQIGYSRADLGGHDGERLQSRQGALAGAYLTGRLGSRLAIQPELLFALKGGRLLAALEGGGTAPLDIELAYIEIPVLAKVAIIPGHSRLHPVLFGGPAPSLRIGCDVELGLDPAPLRAACEDISGFAFKRADLGAVMGGGIQLDWAETALALEVRYTLGLRSILESGSDVRNRQLGVMLALNF